ncbi:hypothetical protein CPB86DRAFT_780031 [Serendipita vermifera]|nr:hypothetical protein CPB86DRAFT_780031 [Serendipita vermifera]
MAWHTPGTIIPNLPHISGHQQLSPAHVPIPVTPIQPMQMLGGQPGGGAYYVQAQPQVQGYGQGYPTVQPAAYPPGYASPYQPQQQMPVYGQPQYVVQGQPMMYQAPQVRERHKSREDNPPLDKFIDGAVYGPVFDLQTATILDIKVQIHPSLRHHVEQDDAPRLSWHILDSVKEAHLMEGEKAKPWTGRESAATFPRLSSLVLITKQFPGGFEIKGTSKSGAVTCHDVINGIHDFAREKLPRSIYDSLPTVKRAKVDATYVHNRSGKEHTPGPDMGVGIRKGDFLEEFTMFDGLLDDPDFVRLASGLKKLPKPGREERTPAGRVKQRPMAGHLVLMLEHRPGDDIPFVVPEPSEATESPHDSPNELDDEDGLNEEEAAQLARMFLNAKQAKSKKKGGNIHQQQHQQPMYPGMVPVQPGGVPVMYAAAPAAGYAPVQQQTPYLMPGGVTPGYVSGHSPMMTTYQLSPMQGYPPLGTPMPGGRHL